MALPLWDSRGSWSRRSCSPSSHSLCTIADFGLAGELREALRRPSSRAGRSWAVRAAVLGRARRVRRSRSSTSSPCGGTDARDHAASLRRVHSRRDRVPRPRRRRRVPRPAGHPVLRALPRRGRALEPPRRLDVVRATVMYGLTVVTRDRRRRRRPAGAAVPLARLPRRERRPALARYAPVGGFVGVVSRLLPRPASRRRC